MTVSTAVASPAVRSALLLLSVLAISTFVYVDQKSHAPISQAALSPLYPNSDQSSFPRRRLQSSPQLDEETLQKQMRSYLGGLYPPVDRDMLPMYLRNIDDTEVHWVLDYSSGEAKPKSTDVVFFWHIPRVGGSTMKNIMNYCFMLKRAEKTLEGDPSMEYGRENTLNMDTSTPDGLAHSFANQLASSGMVDVIVSNYFLSASALFNDQHYGRAFTILRHPVETSLSLFYSRRKLHKGWMEISFQQYVETDFYMDNWMTRQLTGTMPWVALNEDHLERAKLIMKQKLFVGSITEMDETLRQLKEHFGWKDVSEQCTHEFLHDKPVANKSDHPKIPGGRGGATWNVLAQKDKWDFSLYFFGLELFAEQRARYPPIEQGFVAGPKEEQVDVVADVVQPDVVDSREW